MERCLFFFSSSVAQHYFCFKSFSVRMESTFQKKVFLCGFCFTISYFIVQRFLSWGMNKNFKSFLVFGNVLSPQLYLRRHSGYSRL
jgi:small basic protein